MVVDTSVWLDYLYYQQHVDIGNYLNNYLGESGPVEMLPVIYQEVLQGMRTDQAYRRFRRNVRQFDFYYFSNQFEAAHQAASIYRKCRQKGITMRKPNNCLIAHYCLSYNLSLLTIDGDFNHLAKVFPLRIMKI